MAKRKAMVMEDDRKKLLDVLSEMNEGQGDETNLDDGLMCVQLLKHQRLALAWMLKAEKVQSGGFLADDQGLGKTISTISLILKAGARRRCEEKHEMDVDQVDSDEREDDFDDLTPEKVKEKKKAAPCLPCGGTLIVCPKSVMKQWANEIEAKVNEELTVLVYYGSNRKTTAKHLAEYDIVLTTYSLLTQEVPEGGPMEDGPKNKFSFQKSKKNADGTKKPKKKNGPLARVNWNRVVLDEAQFMKNTQTCTAKACYNLTGDKRWCLSGTPAQNSIDDFYSYFRFLKVVPFDRYCHFESEIKTPIKRNPNLGYRKLQVLLKGVMLRRTKDSFLDGQPIINLPAKVTTMRQAEFTRDEREFYNKLEKASKELYLEFKAEGTVQKNYVRMLTMMLRLRQACNHPVLVSQKFKSVTENDDENGLGDSRKLKESERSKLLSKLESEMEYSMEECSICKDAPETSNVVISRCGHFFCKQCVLTHDADDRDETITCPHDDCSEELTVYSLAALKKSSTKRRKTSDSVSDSDEEDPEDQVVDDNSIQPSSKIRAMIEALEDIQRNRPGEKTLIFSQWTGMLDLVESNLRRAGIQFKRLDGTMTVPKREAAISNFAKKPEVTVMLMSLKAGSVGLNMVAASNVMILDPWWNPTTEEQAVDRAHRIGQTRTVNVIRFTIRNSVEDKIMQLQQKKQDMIASAFGEKGGSNAQGVKLSDDDWDLLFS